MEIVNKFEILVIEDNLYGDLRFEGEILLFLKLMDIKGLVIFLGIFFKIFCLGYRLGWICVFLEILFKFNFVK